MVVNRSFVSSYYGPGVDPIGRHLVVTPNPYHSPPNTIVGIAADARESGINQEPTPTVYWCGAPWDPNRVYLVRTSADPAGMTNTVRQTLHGVEPGRAVYDLAPLASHLSEAFSEVQLRTLLLSLFAGTALSLACVGLYGTMSYFVTLRRREIGVRLALGAGRARLGLRFVGQGLSVTVLGVAAGLCLAAWSARFLAGMLYQVEANDGAALGAAMVVMLGVALAASAIPAIRAARADPMRVIREE
jgi:putative ABC transport system permease protein